MRNELRLGAGEVRKPRDPCREQPRPNNSPSAPFKKAIISGAVQKGTFSNGALSARTDYSQPPTNRAPQLSTPERYKAQLYELHINDINH